MRGTRTSTSGGEQEDGRLALAGLLVAFGIFGGVFGVWQVLVADVSRSLDLSTGAIGLAISSGLVASLPAMAVAGRLADHLGRRAVIVGAGVVVGLALFGLALVGSYGMLIGTLVVFFAMTGAYDVGINAQAIGFEQRTGRRILAQAHATFSGAAAVMALTVGALVSSGASFRAVFAGAALVVWGALVVVWFGVGMPRRVENTSGSTAGEQASGEKLSSKKDPSTSRKSLLFTPAIVLVAAIALLANLAQGAMENWSAIYLRQALEFPALLGASGVAVFHAAMLIGRLLATGTIGRFGRQTTLIGAGVLGASGMSLALYASISEIVLAGILIVGLALAAVAPIAFSLAGEVAAGRIGHASSIITTVSYGGLLLGPALIGGLAELVGLHGALTTVIVASVLIAVLGLLGRRVLPDLPTGTKR